MANFRNLFSRFISLSSLSATKTVAETCRFQHVVENVNKSGLASILTTVAEKANESASTGHRTLFSAIGREKVNGLMILGYGSLVPANSDSYRTYFPLIKNELVPPVATKVATKVSSIKGTIWTLANRLKGRVKDVSPDFSDFVDGVEKLKRILTKGPDNPDDSDPVEVPPLTPPSLLPILKPPSPPSHRLGKINMANINVWAIFFVLGMIALALLNLPEKTTISTYSLGKAQKLLGKSTRQYDFVGIFVNEEQYNDVHIALTESTLNAERCLNFINSMDLLWDDVDFVGSIVSGGWLYLAMRGPYRCLLGFGDPGQDIMAMHMGVLLEGDHHTIVLRLREFHHFLIICSANVGEVLNNNQLIDLVSRTRDRKRVSRKIVKAAWNAQPLLNQIYVAVIFFH